MDLEANAQDSTSPSVRRSPSVIALSVDGSCNSINAVQLLSQVNVTPAPLTLDDEIARSMVLVETTSKFAAR